MAFTFSTYSERLTQSVATIMGFVSSTQNIFKSDTNLTQVTVTGTGFISNSPSVYSARFAMGRATTLGSGVGMGWINAVALIGNNAIVFSLNLTNTSNPCIDNDSQELGLRAFKVRGNSVEVRDGFRVADIVCLKDTSGIQARPPLHPIL